jgi:dienelactone hydrolase
MKRSFVWAVVAAAVGLPAARAAEPAGLEVQARGFIDLLKKGDFKAATKDFDDAMNKALPTDKLEATWKGLTEQVGPLKKQGGAREEKTGKYDVVIITCEFEKMKLDARVVYDKDRHISGLNFRPAKPPAEYKAPAYVRRDAFKETEVRVGSGEWALPGVLALPVGDGPFPAVVLVHGSGPNDRDEAILANKPFRDLAWGLASRGIAVLRYDKRTLAHAAQLAKVKDFTVKEETIDDALAAVDLLKKEKGIDGKRIFVLGHSLGGMLVPRIAAGDPSIAGIIALAGATRPLEELMLEQVTYIVSLQGKPSDKDKAELEKLKKDIDRVKALQPSDSGGEPILHAPPSYWLALRDLHPAEEAAKLKVPMLILQGERDYQVTMADFANWKKALAGHKNVTLRTYPKLNHLFMEGEGKSRPAEYEKEGHVAAAVIDDIAAWVKEH